MPHFQPPYDRLPPISRQDSVIDDAAVLSALLAWRASPPDPEFDGIQDAEYEESGEEDQPASN